MEALVITIVAVIIMLLTLSVVFTYVIPLYQNNRKASGGITNHDSIGHKYVYKVYLSRDELIDRLNRRNVFDELTCELDLEYSTIRFSDDESNLKYIFQIQECHGFSIFRLEQSALIAMRSYIPFKLNPYMINKLEAEIIPFSLYGF